MKTTPKTAAKFAAIIMMCLAIAGCANSEKALMRSSAPAGSTATNAPVAFSSTDSSGATGEAAKQRADQSPSGPLASQQQFERKIIVTGNMDLEVKSFDRAEKEIERIVTEARGFVSGATSQMMENGGKYGEITVRMPPSGFGGALKKIKALGKVRSENINRDDVSEEYIDLEARLKNKRRVEETYQTILERATKITDILEVEAKIGEARGEIEQMEGRMKYLDNQVSLSTLKISISEKGVYTAPVPEEWSFRDITKRAIASFVTTMKYIAAILIWAAAYSPLIILAALILIALRRRRGNTKPF